MPNLILINATKRTSGTKVKDFSPAQQFALDINQIISPIRFMFFPGVSYFNTRELSGMDTSSRNNAQISFQVSDTLNQLVAQSDGLVALTVVSRRGVDMKLEKMVFVTARIKEALDIVSTGTRFFYTEDGDPDGVEYIVSQTPAVIVALGNISPIFHMDGYELYVNDVVGNDSTAEKGNPILPWATVDAAITAASVGDNVIITGGDLIASSNLYKNGVNVEVRADASLEIDSYTATGNGTQIIFGEGRLNVADAIHGDATFTGKITVNIGVFNASSLHGVWNEGSGTIAVNCNYSIMQNGCKYLYAVTGTAALGCFKTNINHTDVNTSNNEVNTFMVNPSSLVAGLKIFNFYIAAGNSKSSNEGVLCVANADSTYLINAELNIIYNGNGGSPGLNAVLSCISCTGGLINLSGTHYLDTQGRCALVLNSAITINDYSTTYYVNSNPNRCVTLAGGTSIYTYYGKKLSASTNTLGSISLGVGFTSSSATVDFGTPSYSGGTDTLHFKGGLKCTYANSSAIGILIDNGNGNLIIDGGIVEMTNSNIANDAISANTPQNFKVFGTGFVRGNVNANLTNTIVGSDVIQDTGVTVNI